MAGRRSPGPRYAALLRVVLTASGRRLMGEILPSYYEAAEAVWGGLPLAEAERLSAELLRIARNAERVEVSLDVGR